MKNFRNFLRDISSSSLPIILIISIIILPFLYIYEKNIPISGDEQHIMTGDLSKDLIGTWVQVDKPFGAAQHVIVFKEDGTGLYGSFLSRYKIEWHTYNNELHINKNWLYTIENNIITIQINTKKTTTTRYFEFYSKDTDLYEESDLLVIIQNHIVYIITGGIVFIIFYNVFRHIKKGKKKSSDDNSSTEGFSHKKTRKELKVARKESYEDAGKGKLYLRTDDYPSRFSKEWILDKNAKTLSMLDYDKKTSLPISELFLVKIKKTEKRHEINIHTAGDNYQVLYLYYNTPEAINIADKIKSYIENPDDKPKNKNFIDTNQAKKLNINTATEKELADLPGVGISRAEKAVELRLKNGNFEFVQDFIEQLGLTSYFTNQINDLAYVEQNIPEPALPENDEIVN